MAGGAVEGVHLRVAGAGEAVDVALAGDVKAHVQQHRRGAFLVQLQIPKATVRVKMTQGQALHLPGTAAVQTLQVARTGLCDFYRQAI